ncbi:MAG: peptide ABC transporter substrate-binding protein [Clostridia bacterium]|nr:peptide ABC transporter substrate-binding protein [Clostridia bacterium]MBQ6905722.1 peptide ABC transporter substrate-binding protein [Clostridia bacterium]
MKRLLAILLLAVMCLGLLTACARDENDKGPIIRMYITGYPRSLDPAAVQPSAEVTKLFGLIYEGLTVIDEEGKVQPALAKEWYVKYDEKDGQHKMYFELNETHWSDSTGVSADDVIFAWKRILTPDFESPYASLLYYIKNAKDVKSGVLTSDDLGVAAVDDTLLEVTFADEFFTGENDLENLKKVADLFAETVASTGLVPLRENIVAKNDEWKTKASENVSNGPFKVQTMEYDKQIILERSTYYRLTEDDKEKKFDKYVTPYKLVIDYSSNSQKGTEYQEGKFEEGRTYYLGDFTAEGFAKYADSIVTQKMLSSAVLYFNTTRDALKDKNVRQALSVAIDRENLVAVARGQHVPATGFVPHGVMGANGEFRAESQLQVSTKADEAKAKSLLGSAKPSVTILFRGSNYDKVNEDVANAIKANWEKIGVKVEVKKLSGVNYTEAVTNRDFDVLLTDYVGNMMDPYGYLAPFARYYSGSIVSVSLEDAAYTPNISGIESNEYDAIIDKIVFNSNKAERLELCHQAEALLNDLMPATALYYYTESYVTKPELKNVGSYYFGYRNFNDTTLKDYLAVNSAYDAEVAADADKEAAE